MTGKLIDAEKLKKHYAWWEDDERRTLFDQIVDAQPEVDAEPVRHGKWTVTPIYIKCSECGESFMLIPQNYCPNCGARMDKE